MGGEASALLKPCLGVTQLAPGVRAPPTLTACPGTAAPRVAQTILEVSGPGSRATDVHWRLMRGVASQKDFATWLTRVSMRLPEINRIVQASRCTRDVRTDTFCKR